MQKDNFSQSERINIGGKGDINIQGVNVGGQNNRATYISDKREHSHDIDAQLLSREISILLEALRKEATDTEHLISMGDVANAQKSIEQGNIAKACEYLGKAGKWVLDIAQKVGTQVVAKVIQSGIGL